jgi:nucleotide-binding universal stress UspA family protein
LKVLVATDGSESAMRAVEMAARLSSALGAKLVILTVSAPRLSAEERAEARRQGMSEGDALEGFWQQVLAEARAHAHRAGAADIEALCAVGDPAEQILEAARDPQIQMVVLGRRGRGRLAGLLLGSVSQKLAGLAPCAVVIVP